jgi:uncharacterized membrane protein
MEIVVAAVVWVGTHLGLSSTPLRDMLVRATGPVAFLGIYSLIAAAALVYLVYTYATLPREVYFWLPNPDHFWVPKTLMPLALILILGGFLVRNPTMVGGDLSEVRGEAPAQGVTRITRHPFQWGVVLWAIGHIVVNGDLVSVVFFSAFGFLSLAGGWLIDKKKARIHGEDWDRYARVTSNVPFAALLAGRNRLNVRELWLPVLLGMSAYLVLWYFHEAYTGTVVI